MGATVGCLAGRGAEFFMAVPLLWHKWLVHDIVGEEIWTREDTLIFSIILMIAFVIYVLWDSQKRHNKLKLLF